MAMNFHKPPPKWLVEFIPSHSLGFDSHRGIRSSAPGPGGPSLREPREQSPRPWIGAVGRWDVSFSAVRRGVARHLGRPSLRCAMHGTEEPIWPWVKAVLGIPCWGR